MTTPVQKTVQMPERILRAFLHNLRSGKIKQARGTLSQDSGTIADSKGMCCLGVLQYTVDGDVERELPVHGRVPLSVPTLSWLKKHGITFRVNHAGEVCAPVNPHLPALNASATTANDALGHSFVTIADAFEACTETYDDGKDTPLHVR